MSLLPKENKQSAIESILQHPFAFIFVVKAIIELIQVSRGEEVKCVPFISIVWNGRKKDSDKTEG